jgi:hypothetical protein
MMTFGKWSLILFSSILLGFFVINYIIPALAVIPTGTNHINVSLNTPSDWYYTNTANVNFTYSIAWNTVTANITNCSLMGNFSGGTWTNYSTNTTPIGNNVINGINYTFSTNGPYIWNIYCYNTSLGTGNYSAVNQTLIFDNTNPVLNTTTPATGSYISGNNSQLFQVYVYDTYLNLTNATFYYKYHGGSWQTGSSLTCYVQTKPLFICNTTVNGLGVTYGSGAQIDFYFEASDNATNYNSNGTSSSPLTTIIDRASPNSSSPAVKVSSPATYDTSDTSDYFGFQIDWSDSVSGVYNVTFEANFTGTWANTTATRKSGSNTYYVNFSQHNFANASVGYAYRWYANDSVTPNGAENWAVTGYTPYLLNKASNTVNTFLNGTQNNNATVTYDSTAAINVTGNATDGGIKLYRNGTDVTSTENNTKVALPVGVHMYNVSAVGTANYSANYSGPLYYLTVSQASTTITYLINGTITSFNTNKTIASGTPLNITINASNAQGVIQLYEGTSKVSTDSVNVKLENNTIYSGIHGTQWNITGYYNGSQNYSAATAIWNYIIIESTPPTYTNLTVMNQAGLSYNNVTNDSIIGKYAGDFNISAKWDDNFGLGYYWLSNSTNDSVSFTNTSAIAFTTGNLTNITIVPSAYTGGTVLQLKIYANDTSGNENVTSTYRYTIDGTAPSLTSPSPVNNTYITKNSSYPFHITISDYTLNTSNVTLFYKLSSGEVWGNGTMTCTGTAPTFTCSNKTINLNIYGDGNLIYYYYAATDNSSLIGTNGNSSNPNVVTIDVSAPKYSNNGANASVVGKYDTVLLYAYWTDADTLNTTVLETNETGTAANKTTSQHALLTTFTGSAAWSNFTWSNSSVAVGTVIAWKIYANDSTNNQNVTAIGTFTIDNTVPAYSGLTQNVTNASTIIKGTGLNLTVVWSDNVRLDKYWASRYNSTGNAWVNDTPTAMTSNNQTDILISTSSYNAGDNITFRIYANDTSGNDNVTTLWQYAIDGNASTYANQSNSVSGEAVYTPGKTYIFNISWTDNLGDGNVSTVLLNFSSLSANQTVTPLGSSNYSKTLTGLGVGNYTYKWYANDTSNNWNSTPIYTLNITQNTTNPINMYLVNSTNTVTNGNISITAGSTVTVNGTFVYSNSGTMALYSNVTTLNATLINVSSSYTTSSSLTGGSYTFIANTTGNTNYTANATGPGTFYLTVTADNTAPTVLLYDYTNATAKKSGSGLTLNISVWDDTGITPGDSCNVTIAGVTNTTITYSNGWCNGTITVPSTTEGTYLINISVKDNSTIHNVGINNTNYIIIDNTTPIVTVSTPANGIYSKLSGAYYWINGTISDNLQMGTGNVTINSTYFNISASNYGPYSFNGTNNTDFAFRNTSRIPDGYYAIKINYTDNASNTGEATVYFYVDNNASTSFTALTTGTKSKSATQQVQVNVTDNLMTNASITLNYLRAGLDLAWQTKTMTGTPAATTTYSATIDTSMLGDGAIVYYYVTGVDNATNSFSTNNGSATNPLSNFKVGVTGFNYTQDLTGSASGTWNTLWIPSQSVMEGMGYTSATTNAWNISYVLTTIGGLGTNYNLVYYYNGTSWTSFNIGSWAASSLQYMNNTNDKPYWINMTANDRFEI